MSNIQSRKRYIVKLERNSETVRIVVIAKNLESMYREVYRLYGDFLIDEKGMDTGTISFEEIALSPTVK
ncbi:hypothetical protein M3221_24240 [Domibacillus indicus]|jgi:hypothetical protein|uniref:hypothetical protein n=1 Tax=Domibacillus indicus TaxID=1437523 RepID=UPI00203C0C2E|nr:hypothetical protein [Domibacillus indicus]MCM3791441.1 hypothetical protein [Domibacillus indicus]